MILLLTILLAVAMTALIILSPLTFEMVAGVALVSLLIVEAWGLRSSRHWQPATDETAGNGPSKYAMDLFAVGEIGLMGFAAALMYALADFSAVAALLVFAIGVVSSNTFRRAIRMASREVARD
jgi:hypothetical protein